MSLRILGGVFKPSEPRVMLLVQDHACFKVKAEFLVLIVAGKNLKAWPERNLKTPKPEDKMNPIYTERCLIS